MKKTMLLCLVMTCAALMPACATEDDYVVVIPDTTDGPDEVILEDWPDGVGFKTAYTNAIEKCGNLQEFHYEAHSACYQTYHNLSWLQGAYAFCNSYVQGMHPDCYDEFSAWMWMSYTFAWNSYPPAGWVGDGNKWTCLGGWPVMTTPNSSDALRAEFYACDPNYVTAPDPVEFAQGTAEL